MHHIVFILFALLSAYTTHAQPTPQIAIQTATPQARPAPRKACIEAVYTDRIKRYHRKNIAYIKAHADDAIYIEWRYGIPAHITLAVAMYESGYGRSEITQNACNHFGRKFYQAPQYMGELQPYECEGTLWQAYDSARACYIAFAEAVALAPYRYPYCKELTPEEFAATGWGGRGRAEQREYARALKSIIWRYNLTAL